MNLYTIYTSQYLINAFPLFRIAKMHLTCNVHMTGAGINQVNSQNQVRSQNGELHQQKYSVASNSDHVVLHHILCTINPYNQQMVYYQSPRLSWFDLFILLESSSHQRYSIPSAAH